MDYFGDKFSIAYPNSGAFAFCTPPPPPPPEQPVDPKKVYVASHYTQEQRNTGAGTAYDSEYARWHADYTAWYNATYYVQPSAASYPPTHAVSEAQSPCPVTQRKTAAAPNSVVAPTYGRSTQPALVSPSKTVLTSAAVDYRTRPPTTLSQTQQLAQKTFIPKVKKPKRKKTEEERKRKRVLNLRRTILFNQDDSESTETESDDEDDKVQIKSTKESTEHTISVEKVSHSTNEVFHEWGACLPPEQVTAARGVAETTNTGIIPGQCSHVEEVSHSTNEVFHEWGAALPLEQVTAARSVAETRNTGNIPGECSHVEEVSHPADEVFLEWGAALPPEQVAAARGVMVTRNTDNVSHQRFHAKSVRSSFDSLQAKSSKELDNQNNCDDTYTEWGQTADLNSMLEAMDVPKLKPVRPLFGRDKLSQTANNSAIASETPKSLYPSLREHIADNAIQQLKEINCAKLQGLNNKQSQMGQVVGESEMCSSAQGSQSSVCRNIPFVPSNHSKPPSLMDLDVRPTSNFGYPLNEPIPALSNYNGPQTTLAGSESGYHPSNRYPYQHPANDVWTEGSTFHFGEEMWPESGTGGGFSDATGGRYPDGAGGRYYAEETGGRFSDVAGRFSDAAGGRFSDVTGGSFSDVAGGRFSEESYHYSHVAKGNDVQRRLQLLASGGRPVQHHFGRSEMTEFGVNEPSPFAPIKEDVIAGRPLSALVREVAISTNPSRTAKAILAELGKRVDLKEYKDLVSILSKKVAERAEELLLNLVGVKPFMSSRQAYISHWTKYGPPKYDAEGRQLNKGEIDVDIQVQGKIINPIHNASTNDNQMLDTRAKIDSLNTLPAQFGKKRKSNVGGGVVRASHIPVVPVNPYETSKPKRRKNDIVLCDSNAASKNACFHIQRTLVPGIFKEFMNDKI